MNMWPGRKWDGRGPCATCSPLPGTRTLAAAALACLAGQAAAGARGISWQGEAQPLPSQGHTHPMLSQPSTPFKLACRPAGLPLCAAPPRWQSLARTSWSSGGCRRPPATPPTLSWRRAPSATCTPIGPTRCPPPAGLPRSFFPRAMLGRFPAVLAKLQHQAWRLLPSLHGRVCSMHTQPRCLPRVYSAAPTHPPHTHSPRPVIPATSPFFAPSPAGPHAAVHLAGDGQLHRAARVVRRPGRLVLRVPAQAVAAAGQAGRHVPRHVGAGAYRRLEPLHPSGSSLLLWLGLLAGEPLRPTRSGNVWFTGTGLCAAFGCWFMGAWTTVVLSPNAVQPHPAH